MAEKLRVHMLSKELGVTSKAIVEKCRLEEVEGITNHMSTVSAGLAETIREWFSEGAHATAVEQAAPVDLKKVRRPARKRKPKKADSEAETGDVQTATAVEERTETEPMEAAVTGELGDASTTGDIAAPVAEPESPERRAAPREDAAPPDDQPPAGEEAPAKEDAGKAAARAEGQTEPVARVDEPEKKRKPPEQIRPAGPQNVPAPAQMKGPKVIGFAKPDTVETRPPRSMPRGPQAPDLPGPADWDAGGAGGRRGGKRGKGDETGEGKRRHRGSPRRSSTSVDVDARLREWRDRDLLERQERLQAASGRGLHARRPRDKKAGGQMPHHIAPRKTKAQIKEPILIHELTAATGISMMQMFGKFKEHEIFINRNTVVPSDIAQLVMLEFGVELEVVKPKTPLEEYAEGYQVLERHNLQPRPAVVTMLGHVDHGKTSLLDRIRQSSVAEGEAGGITQHIGAYQVEKNGLKVTFLDTPGHEAFTAMRARGANMTDVVVLVVAADDGVMPQTIEAINHAKAAGVAIVVALNKIDIPGTDVNKVYGQLAEHGLSPVEWGGETDVIKTSAETGQGVDELFEHLATVSELLELKADPTIPASGTVIESEIKTGMGVTTRLLVREGTLHASDFVTAGPGAGRIRLMQDHLGRQVDVATPGMPVELIGLDEPPNAGDPFYAVESLQLAKTIAEGVREMRRDVELSRTTKAKAVTLEDLFQQRESGEIPELNMILRADVQGSMDALINSLNEIPSEEVRLNILHSGLASITESDVVLAQASDALIVGFNVAPEPGAKRLADSEGIDIRQYRVIYDVLDDIRKALEGLLQPDRTEETRGKAEVREVFRVSKVGNVAGCLVSDGVISRAHYVRVMRDGKIVVPTAEDVKKGRHRAIGSLRRFKDDVKEVRAGMECGIHVEGFDDVKPGDVLEAYEVIETARKL